jgi:hypothetical protein
MITFEYWEHNNGFFLVFCVRNSAKMIRWVRSSPNTRNIVIDVIDKDPSFHVGCNLPAKPADVLVGDRTGTPEQNGEPAL